ncbi:PaaX family transcriptional regulator [Haloechinothrix halophila]|uniref:PaaX family transcriptional regulator n=1 Tax=Haloechinothrix halophila TaxID=1069073 RepID=UPI000411070D|nr:PaaX family transcriptional regulator C-terminal domain-containing protein [Haloechinothrix halophila]
MTLLGAYVWPREDGQVWAGGLVALLAEMGFREGAARVALTRLARRDLIARRKQGRLVYYTLTERARRVLAEGDSRIFTLGANGTRSAAQWTLLWHGIPDTHRRAREALVRRLRFLGFGPIQDGTWLAVRDAVGQVSDLLDDLEVREHAGLLRCSPGGVADARALITRAWDLDALAEAYAAFVGEFAAASATDDRSAFLLRTRLVHTFRQFPFRDPELPAELIAAPEQRADAVALFHELYATLAPAAQRHFDEVTTP